MLGLFVLSLVKEEGMFPMTSLQLEEPSSTDSLAFAPQSFEHLSELDPARFFAPKQADKPWIRWYWPGTDVSFPRLLEELDWVIGQGYGGVEIVITGRGISPNKRKGAFRDPRWLETLRQLAAVAQKRGMMLDWTIGPGIPSEYSRGIHTFASGEAHVRGDRLLSMAIPGPSLPIGHQLASVLSGNNAQDSDWLSWNPDSANLLGVWAARATKDERSALFWNTTDAIYLDPDSSFLLNEYLVGDSIIGWQAPKGYWKILACYDMDAGQHPFYSTAHFQEVSADPTTARDWMRGLAIHPLTQSIPSHSSSARAVRLEVQWPAVDRILPEHSVRDFPFPAEKLAPTLLVPAADHQEADRIHLKRGPAYQWMATDAHLRQVYEHWLSDELLKNSVARADSELFSAGFRSKMCVEEWHHGWFNMASKIALPAFTSAIAGGDRMAAKLVASGAQYGQRERTLGYVGRVPQRAYHDVPQHTRIEIDRVLLSGAEEIVIDGLAHEFSGMHDSWHPSATREIPAVNFGGQFGPAQPFEERWPAVMTYTARAQYLLRLGRPETDLLVLFPFSRFPYVGVDSIWSLVNIPIDSQLLWNQISPLGQNLLTREYDSLQAWVAGIRPFLNELESWGYSWDFISAPALDEATMKNGNICAGGLNGKALLIPEGGVLKLKTLNRLGALADEGGRVFLLGKKLPEPLELVNPDSARKEIVKGLHRFQLPFPLQKPSELLSLLREEQVQPPVAFSRQLQDLRQRIRLLEDSSRLVWLVNLSGQPIRATAFVPKGLAYVLNPENGKARKVSISVNQVAEMTLGPYESQAFVFGRRTAWPDSLLNSDIDWERMKLEEQGGAYLVELSRWDMSFSDPNDPKNIHIRKDTTLSDWSLDDELVHFHGEILYTSDLMVVGSPSSGRHILDLGKLHDAVEVRVNTTKLPIKNWQPFRFDIGPYLRPGLNTIELWVSNSSRNNLVGRAEDGDEFVEFLLGNQEELRKAGLLGPVYYWRIPLSPLIAGSR
ncbi:MAG: hypothetical protein NWR72_03160 [Bacteroidia bacterium]|nr:hypothetical protein [Bacteroidia bacterium]